MKGVKSMSYINIPAGSQVIIGTPNDYPHKMINAVAEYLKGQKNVKAAYFTQMFFNETFSYIIVVDFKGNEIDTMDGIAAVATPFLPQGFPLDLTPLDDDFTRGIARDYKPFYRRKVLGIF
jgi:hypothetical protein